MPAAFLPASRRLRARPTFSTPLWACHLLGPSAGRVHGMGARGGGDGGDPPTGTQSAPHHLDYMACALGHTERRPPAA